jgi:hypothetical protein
MILLTVLTLQWTAAASSSRDLPALRIATTRARSTTRGRPPAKPARKARGW